MASSKLLQRGARWMRNRLPEAAAETVVIIDGTESISAIEAIPGRRDIEQYLVEEAAGTAKTFDWIVAADDLFFDGAKREPASGWEIRWLQEDGRTLVYKVLPEAGTRCFDTVDQLGLLYRIHSKLDMVEPAK